MTSSQKDIVQKDIAVFLAITPGSLNCHLANIRKTLNAHNTAEILRATTAKTKRNRAQLALTPRGKKVFTLMVQGYSDMEIANKMNISYQRVRRHKEKMLLQNGCASVPELFAKYYMTNEEAEKTES